MEQRRRTKERRHPQRLPLAVPIFARGLDDRGKEFLEFTMTLNIGAGGALIAMRRCLPPGAAITLEIPAAPVPRLSNVPKLERIFQARVVRVTPSESAYLWAVIFDHPLS